MPTVQEVHYKISQPVLGGFPGAHKSPRGDGGFEFRGHAGLLDARDPRRIDLLASLRDPMGPVHDQWRVRVYAQRKAVPVVVVADLSASMAFEGAQRRTQVLADLVDSVGQSAWRHGDRFGFVGADAELRRDFIQWPTRARGAGALLAQRLRAWRPAPKTARSAEGLLQAHLHLGQQRALVFLVSDFHWPLPLLRGVLASLARHDVVPVVLWDERETSLSAAHGLAQVVDPETGRRRLVWWRPWLRQRWADALAARRAALARCFSEYQRTPLYIEGMFDADAVTRHFHR